MPKRPAPAADSWTAINRGIVECTRCPRLVRHCRSIGAAKRAAFGDWDYWARGVPNFGDPRARLLVVGLAPAAHGANRTGRMFTGDRSGQWLFRALHAAGFASQAGSESRDDGLRLVDCAITAVAHCAPPDNKPSPVEIARCHEWLEHTIDCLPVQVFAALGQIAWRQTLVELRRRCWHTGRFPKFAHLAVVPLANERWLIGSYHPSQQNTFTGRLTEEMLDKVFDTAKRLLH